MTRISDEHKDDYNRKLKSYYRCMKGREKYIKQRITPIQAIVALRDAELELQCFRWFMKRQPNEPKLGDHFELILPKVSRKDMGWYRCIKRVNNTMNIANMYYVDIINKSVETEEQAMSHEFANLKLQSRAIATPWSECSICDTRKGEMRRKIVCHLKVATVLAILYMLQMYCKNQLTINL
uniref:Uncharacterized protein n=1 Tax=Onchocerca volvulus TaxID=6282 RepID=A0A8R1XSH6_ONCVO